MRSVALVTNGAMSVANFRGQVVAELARRGVRVHALAPDWCDRTRAAARACGAEPVDISLSRTGMNPVRDGADVLRLAATLRRLRPDAVLTYFVKPNIYGTLAATVARVPRRIAMVEGLGVVFDAEMAATRKRRLLRGVNKALYRAAFAHADKVLFLNREDEAFFVRERLVAAAKAIRFGAIGVDLNAFAAVPPVAAPITFVMMARLVRQKGVLVFAEAAAKVRAVAPDARFLLLGAFDSNPDSLGPADLQHYIDDGTIDWPGHVDDVRARLAAASVFVLPSWYPEGVPRSSQEAAAMGKPVITTDAVGCRDTVEDGVNGLLVPPRNVDALAAAMLRFVREPRLIASMGAASRRMAEARWDGAQKAAELADLLLPH